MASQNLNPLFSAGISKNIIYNMDAWMSPIHKIFHFGTTKMRVIDHQMWAGYGLPGSRLPGEPIQAGSISASFAKRYVVNNFGLLDSFPMEDINDDIYGIINLGIPKVGGGMARSFQDQYDTDTAAWFSTSGYGTSPQYMADGKSLFNTAHPVSSTNAATWSNRPSTDVDLSIASVQAGITNLRLQKLPNNISYANVNPRILVINPAQSFVAQQIVKQTLEVGTADHNDNFIKPYDIEIVQWPFFQVSGATGSNNAWFLVGDDHFLNFFMRSDFETDSDKDINTNSQIVIGTSRYAFGADDARFTYGSKGS